MRVLKYIGDKLLKLICSILYLIFLYICILMLLTLCILFIPFCLVYIVIRPIIMTIEIIWLNKVPVEFEED